MVVDVLVPARNCAATIAGVLDGVRARSVRSVVVIDNDSDDSTAQIALDRGAVVLRERARGYGASCRRGQRHLESLPRPPDAVVFLPADGSADPAEIPSLLEPIAADNAELVVGVREKGRGCGSRLGVAMIGAIYRHRFTDIGPFRAIRFAALVALGLRDRGDGWNAEMQVKAVKLGLQIVEVPVTEQGAGARDAARGAALAGRTLFQILRHSTAR